VAQTGPGGDRPTPNVIVTRHRPPDVSDASVYILVNSVERAVGAASELAGEKDIDVSATTSERNCCALESWTNCPSASGRRIANDPADRPGD
jgi:hypothetical protein